MDESEESPLQAAEREDLPFRTDCCGLWIFIFLFLLQEEAADLEGDAKKKKKHNKVIIQGKHLRSADSNAADGCKLIMSPDRPPLELMTRPSRAFSFASARPRCKREPEGENQQPSQFSCFN